jgi:hypothetical protein
MKVLFCIRCQDIRAFSTEYTPCKCGNMEARWIDPNTGTVMIRARNRDHAKLIGLNNRMLHAMVYLALDGGFDFSSERWRELHDDATAAPGYLFDKSRRNCWAVIIGIGSSNDVKWDPDQEKYSAGDFTGWTQRVPAELRLSMLRANYRLPMTEEALHKLIADVLG